MKLLHCFQGCQSAGHITEAFILVVQMSNPLDYIDHDGDVAVILQCHTKRQLIEFASHRGFFVTLVKMEVVIIDVWGTLTPMSH